MTTELELFNAHQEDVRRRVDSLAKSIFVLAGGTLTISIGIFTRVSAPHLSEGLSFALKASWWSLFIAIIALVLGLTTIIIRDYAFGERWRKKIIGKDLDVTGSPTAIDIVIWFFGLLGLFSFLIGLVGQAYVASSLL